jgi:hypothetical protein
MLPREAPLNPTDTRIESCYSRSRRSCAGNTASSDKERCKQHKPKAEEDVPI